jgi:D-3-phosphoglycerate dehydrogenase
MAKILITTVPFGDADSRPLNLLRATGVDFLVNPLGRKLREDELAEMIADAEVLIAGTENISESVMARAPNLKLISRVGIGLDSVDLLAARRRQIHVSYTPDAPAKAVAELTIGLIFSLLRGTHVSNTELHAGRWQRHMGRRLEEVTVGLIGVGRIGTGVLARLQALGCRRILANDLLPVSSLETAFRFSWAEKETIYREADVLSIHVPLTPHTRNMVARQELITMKADACLINTARGGIVNEADLADLMQHGHLSGAAIDVFEQEPYNGSLATIDRCLLTAHLGSMSVDCRVRMELEATEEALRFLRGEPLVGEVPEAEFEARR